MLRWGMLIGKALSTWLDQDEGLYDHKAEWAVWSLLLQEGESAGIQSISLLSYALRLPGRHPQDCPL